MAAAVDIGYVAGHLGLDQPVLTTLTTEPTADLVATLLQAVAAKAHEFDTLYAEKLQTDIELENAVRSSESRSQTFKATADKALKDVEEARQHLKEEGKRAPNCVTDSVCRVLTMTSPQRPNASLSRTNCRFSRARTPITMRT